MKNKGITIIELTIVLSIIALLVAITVPNLLRIRQEANESKIKAELKTIHSGISIYYLEKSTYPKSFNDLKGYLNNLDYFSDKFELNTDL